MRTSIATVCLSGRLEEKLAAIAAAGFRAVELFENDLLSWGGTAADVAKMVADLGLEIVTFQPFRDFEGMPDNLRPRVFERVALGEDRGLRDYLSADLIHDHTHPLQRAACADHVVNQRDLPPGEQLFVFLVKV